MENHLKLKSLQGGGGEEDKIYNFILNAKKLRLCRKLKFSNHYIFVS